MNFEIKNFYQNKCILVTGASGFIASALIDELCSIECTVVRLSRSNLPTIEKRKAEVIDVKLQNNAQNIEELVTLEIDVVFHLAGQTSIYEADKNPLLSFEGNIGFFVRLLHFLRKTNKKICIILASTVTIFGCQEPFFMDELFKDNPSTLYDHEKLYMEKYLTYFVKKGWLTGGSLRLSNVYGCRTKVSSEDRNVISKIIDRALKKKELTLFNGGSFVRDYIYVKDVVSAFLYAGCFFEKLEGEKFIISTGRGLTLKEAIKIIDYVLNAHSFPSVVNVVNKKAPEGLFQVEFRNFIGDSRAFKDKTGWVARIPFEKGIGKIIQEMQEKVVQ